MRSTSDKDLPRASCFDYKCSFLGHDSFRPNMSKVKLDALVSSAITLAMAFTDATNGIH